MWLRLTIGFGMLDAVYMETKELKQIVEIHPKPAFGPVFQAATAREGSAKVLIKESPQTACGPGETGPCSWWRRGRVELYLTHGLAGLAALDWPGMISKSLADSCRMPWRELSTRSGARYLLNARLYTLHLRNFPPKPKRLWQNTHSW